MRTLATAALLVLALAECKKEESHPPVLGEVGSNPGSGIAPKNDGGASPEAGATGLLASVATPTGLALDATNAYVTSIDGSLSRIGRAAGALDRLAGDLKSPANVAIAGADLFFLESTGISRFNLS